MSEITIKNAYLHNLKNIDLVIPKGKLTVVTGISGSGKSTMCFDIIGRQGARNYIESIGIPMLLEEKKGFSSMEGLSAVVAQRQNLKNLSNPRSVVGTFTGILKDLRVLMFHEGKIYCSVCGGETLENLVCSECGHQETGIVPGNLSFNSPLGMCLNCKGRGKVLSVDYGAIFGDGSEKISDMIKRLPITGNVRRESFAILDDMGTDTGMIFNSLDEKTRKFLLFGRTGEFWGFIPNIEWRVARKKSDDIPYAENACRHCGGSRICDDGRKVRLNGRNISELSEMALKELYSFIDEYSCREKHGGRLKQNILKSLGILIESDLEHINLYLPIPDLSGGELQRLMLCKYLHSEMQSIVYVFDEPTTGLHEIEKGRLIEKILSVKDNGNTVIVVEHDINTINAAEHLIDFGPLAGSGGGEVVYSGDVSGITGCEKSITGEFLSGKYVPEKAGDFDISDKDFLKIRNCRVKNLKDISVDIPLNTLVGIAGVSGSGKSSLIKGCLMTHLKKHFKKSAEFSGEYDEIRGIECGTIDGADKLCGYSFMGQNPIGRNNRSNLITYTGIANSIRRFFANVPDSVKRGYDESHFSFNSAGGCCLCGGSGRIGKYIRGVGDVYSVCPKCEGRRFSDEILEIEYREKNILDVQDMEVDTARDFFSDFPVIGKMLDTLCSCGMGYLKLGQPTPTISGGEGQRLKLAVEMGRKRSGNILYILDEPTTGLSFYDTFKLIPQLKSLVEDGNSVIIIEHDPMVLSACGYIIEMGPGHGPEGGKIIASGTVEDLKSKSGSVIGNFLI